MSIGYAGACSDVVEQRCVQEQCPNEFQALLDTIRSVEPMTLESFAKENEYSWDYNDYHLDDKAIHTLQSALDVLKKAFRKKTGLILELGYHDKENDGDRYDDVEGVIWYVSGAWKRTAAGKKWEEEIIHAHWVMLG